MNTPSDLHYLEMHELSLLIRSRKLSPVEPPVPEGLEIVEVRDESTLAALDRTLVEAYPIPALRGQRQPGADRAAADARRVR